MKIPFPTSLHQVLFCWGIFFVSLGASGAAMPIRVPADNPKWELKFPIAVTTGTTKNYNTSGGSLGTSSFTVHNKTIAITNIADRLKSFGCSEAMKPHYIRYLKGIIAMAKQAAQKKDVVEREKEMPGFTRGHSQCFFVVKSGEYFGKLMCLNGLFALFTIEELEDLVGILDSWAKYEGEARKGIK